MLATETLRAICKDACRECNGDGQHRHDHCNAGCRYNRCDQCGGSGFAHGAVERELAADLIDAREAINGSTDAPTDEELAAHDDYWRAAWTHLPGGFDWMNADVARQKRETILAGSLRWWKIDRSGRVVGR